MQTLILNGSPRKNGDTASLLQYLRQYLDSEILEFSAYYDNIPPASTAADAKNPVSV
jgi:NAD(P)H-dependent FMN reductase